MQRKENGALDVSNNANSEIFKILSKIAKDQKAEFKFIYDQYSAGSVETFTGDNYDDLISQVLKSGKSFFLPQIDLILQNNGDAKIECYIGKATFNKLESLCNIAKEMGQALSCDALSYTYIIPEEVLLSGVMDLPD